MYKDTLEKSRIDEIIEKFEGYGLVHMVTENQEYVYTEAWTIHEGEKFEFYPDDRRLIAEF